MLCIIDSGLSLSRIREILVEYGDIGPIRALWKKDKETRKSLAVLGKDTFQALVDAGFSHKRFNVDLSIAPFDFREAFLPDEGKTLNWKIMIPPRFTTPSEVHSIVKRKLEDLVKFDILPSNECYRIDIPLRSRVTEELSGICFVIFKGLEPKTIAMARLICNDSVWDGVPEAPQFSIRWAINRTDRAKKPAAEKHE